MSAVIVGLDKLRQTLQRLGAAASGLAAGALYREAERIMTTAKELTPVLTGALRASGQVQQPAIASDAVKVTMGFGNSAVNYAVYVHENLRARHHVGQAKFLEQPLNEARAGMDARLAADVRAEVERAAGKG